MSIVEYAPPTAIESGNRWVDLVAPAAQLAAQIANTDFVPAEMRNKPAAVTACILYGAEIGIGPMQSLAKVDIVKGRPAPRAELARALALAAGHEVRVEESTNTKVTVAGRRSGSDFWQRVTWTMDDVKKAGIVNQAYSKYPRQMLLARASAELVRAMCPDVLGGIGQFAEELDGGEQPTTVEPTVAVVASAGKRQRRPLQVALPPAELPPLPTDEAVDDREAITDPQKRKLMACFNDLGVTERDVRLTMTSAEVGRPVASANELTKDEAAKVIDMLERAISERDEDSDPGVIDAELIDDGAA